MSRAQPVNRLLVTCNGGPHDGCTIVALLPLGRGIYFPRARADGTPVQDVYHFTHVSLSEGVATAQFRETRP